MKVSDVIKNCFVKLGYGVVDVTDTENLTTEQKRLIDILSCCVENVHSEIISAYFPNVVTENVTLVDGKLEYSTLKNSKIVYPISLKRGAETRKIKAYPTFLQSDFSGDATFEFCALLQKYELSTELPGNVPCWLLSEGVVAEYAYASNLIDLGAQAEKKFREGICALKAHGGAGRYVKPRRWA